MIVYDRFRIQIQIYWTWSQKIKNKKNGVIYLYLHNVQNKLSTQWMAT